MLDVVRQCQRAGVFRLERNRQGVLRIFQGDELDETHRGCPVNRDSCRLAAGTGGFRRGSGPRSR